MPFCLDSICQFLLKYHSFHFQFSLEILLPFFLLLHMSYQIRYLLKLYGSLHYNQEQVHLISIHFLLGHLDLYQKIFVLRFPMIVVQNHLLVIHKMLSMYFGHLNLYFLHSKYVMELKHHKKREFKMEELAKKDCQLFIN